jgi:hypothetical protein
VKKQFLIYFFSLAAIFHCNAQIINLKPVDVTVGSLNFSSEVIKQNKIKSITVDIVDKPDGAVIVDKDAAQGYQFDINGRLTNYYYTVLDQVQVEEVDVPAIKKHGRVIRPATTRTVSKYINDTTNINVFYDSVNRIIAKRLKTGDYYDAYYYEYDSLGREKKEMHCRETNISENKNEFKMGVQKVLSSETFLYTSLTPTQIKKQCLNDEGREYKKAIINYDEKGNKLSENYDFIVSWMRQENVFQYDGNGRLQEKTYTSNESGELKEYSVYEYNPNGVLLEEKRFKNNILTFEISYLYDETFTILKSQVSRDHKNASIGIVKYACEFY